MRFDGNLEKLQRLESVVSALQGELHLLHFEEHLPLVPYPFPDHRMGVDYNNRKIYIKKSLPNERPWSKLEVLRAIHEMAHVFAVRTAPSRTKDEFLMFGWESLVARKLNIHAEFLKFHRVFVHVKARVTLALEVGKRYGNINPKGQPVSVRDDIEVFTIERSK